MPWKLTKRMKDRVRKLFGRRVEKPVDRNATSPAEKLVQLVLLDALRKNASEILIVFGRDWTGVPLTMARSLRERCSVFYMIDGVPREVMCPPERLSDEIVECVMKRLTYDYRAEPGIENPTEFNFVPPPHDAFAEGPPVNATTFRVELSNENDAAVLILRPI
ncbi:hypothetical protein EBS80_02295 [bacterium]|nr:hypothetical protein [bacterium]